MNGRRRRASTSSVETVDAGQIRWLQETSVVRSVPKDLPTDSWPSFELRDAVVLDRDGKVFENALDVGTRGPYVVRGHLVIEDPAQKSHLIMKVRASTPIEIRTCTKYAIGETGDGGHGHPLIWVSGRGGWYEISPSDAYLPVFNKMCEATTMYYNLMDIYNPMDICNFKRPKKSHKKSAHSGQLDALSSVFLQYVTRVGDGSTLDEVVDRCAEHASFFVNQFALESTNMIDWTSTGFYKWFRTKHAHVFKKFDEVTKSPRKLPRTPSVDLADPVSRNKAGPVARSASIEEIEPGQFLPSQRKPSKPSPASRGDEASPGVASQSPAISTQSAELAAHSTVGDDSPFASVFAAFELAYSKRGDSKKGLTILNTLNEFYFNYKFPTYKDSTVGSHKVPVMEVLHYNAPALLQALDKERYQNHEIYSLLQDLSQKEFSPVVLNSSKFPYRMVPRKPNPRQSKKPDSAELRPAIEALPFRAAADDAETEDPPRRLGKRPKRPGQRPGRKSALRTLTSSKKRAHAEVESGSETESEASGPKRSHYFSNREGDATMPDAVEANSSGNAEAAAAAQPRAMGEPIKIVIQAERVPSTLPRGPEDAWTCSQDSCDYIVRGGDDEECQARIRQHFDGHEKQTKRLNLAVTESSRGHLPINHLLQKLKNMGDKAQQSQQLSVEGVPLPQPIKRKLIV